MEQVLIICNNTKVIDNISQLVLTSISAQLHFADDLLQAEKYLTKYDFSLIIIVSLLPNKIIYNFTSLCSKTNAGIMLVVKDEPHIDEFEKFARQGICIFSLNMGKRMFINSIHLLVGVHYRFCSGTIKEQTLQRKIDEIRLVDRAKCLLIQYSQMTEEQAHHFIEKEAMDNRVTRKDIAQKILDNYNL